MKQLTEYKKNGFSYTILKRKGQVALAHGISTTSETWEVIHIRQNEAGERFGKMFEASESPPGNNEWGSRGFTCSSLVMGERKFDLEVAINRLKE